MQTCSKCMFHCMAKTHMICTIRCNYDHMTAVLLEKCAQVFWACGVRKYQTLLWRKVASKVKKTPNFITKERNIKSSLMKDTVQVREAQGNKKITSRISKLGDICLTEVPEVNPPLTRALTFLFAWLGIGVSVPNSSQSLPAWNLKP